VDDGSFLGRLRAKTGLTFDLPTEAQWEYACRAGTTGALHDGTVNIASETVDASLAQLGRYAYNGGRPNGTGTPVVSCATNEATAEVGSYIPNAWGLYDMHGNVFEWCLDGFDTTNPQLPGGTDPVGVPVDTARIRRSGSWAHPAKDNRSALRSYGGPHYETEGDTGFRLTRTLQ
jgi:formylglycine-generating enzyme required for sulfatase activity